MRRGEIVGLYGLIGAGRSEFAQWRSSAGTPKTAGEILWRASPVESGSEKDAIDHGIVLVPESRRDQGLCLNLGVGFNLNLPIFERLSPGGSLSGRDRERAAADRQIADLRHQVADVALRGGLEPVGRQPAEDRHRQVAEPRRRALHLRRADGRRRRRHQGRDLQALRRSSCARGAGIILISSYLPEVYELADTLHVFRRGRLVGKPSPHDGVEPRDHPHRGHRHMTAAGTSTESIHD